MVELSNWLGFLAIAIAATISPGPAMLLAIRNGANVGLRLALFGIIGNVSAMLCYAALASSGLAFIFAKAPTIVFAIQIIGGCYLAYIGFRLLTTKSNTNVVAEKRGTIFSKSKLFKEAFLVGASNPKAIVFYSALFPQFIVPNHSVAGQAVILALTFGACSFLSLCFYAWLGSKAAGRLLASGRGLSRINIGAGSVFIFLGGALAVHGVLGNK